MFWVSVFLCILFVLFLAWACYQAYIGCGIKEKSNQMYAVYQYGKQNMPPPMPSTPPPLPESGPPKTIY
jgi:hypothetical protein